jgi:hypothetical protein
MDACFKKKKKIYIYIYGFLLAHSIGQEDGKEAIVRGMWVLSMKLRPLSKEMNME